MYTLLLKFFVETVMFRKERIMILLNWRYCLSYFWPGITRFPEASVSLVRTKAYAFHWWRLWSISRDFVLSIISTWNRCITRWNTPTKQTVIFSFFFLTVLFCRMRRFSLISSLLCLDSIIVRINGVRLYKEKWQGRNSQKKYATGQLPEKLWGPWINDCKGFALLQWEYWKMHTLNQISWCSIKPILKCPALNSLWFAN